VIADHADLRAEPGLAADLVQEAPKAHRPVPGTQLADDLDGGDVSAPRQVGVVPGKVDAAPPRARHRQHRSAAMHKPGSAVSHQPRTPPLSLAWMAPSAGLPAGVLAGVR
jgi:hypothetical protein